jgi:hypothetical protein
MLRYERFHIYLDGGVNFFHEALRGTGPPINGLRNERRVHCKWVVPGELASACTEKELQEVLGHDRSEGTNSVARLRTSSMYKIVEIAFLDLRTRVSKLKCGEH